MKSTTREMTATALLIAIGIAIPMFSPIKFVMEPASFTLASHVAIFVAMMISPSVGIGVAIGTTVGFALNFPPVIALRAASHLVFVTLGGLYLKKHPRALASPAGTRAFSFVIALIHACCEVFVVCVFFFSGNLSTFSEFGFARSVVLLVGLGSVIHSMVDFEIALLVRKALIKGGATLFTRPTGTE